MDGVQARLWDQLTARTPDVDPWCTSSRWAASASEAFGTHPAVVEFGPAGHEVPQFAWCVQHHRLVDSDGNEHAAVVGPDPVWSFSSAVVGDLRAGAAELGRWLRREPGWRVALLGGYAPGSASERMVVEGLGQSWDVHAGPESLRLVADLRAGSEDWFERRSPSMRRNLRRAKRSAAGSGIRFEPIDQYEPDAIIDRLTAIEHESWKGSEATGLLGDSMRDFVRRVLERTLSSQRRVCVATLDGHDVGFIAGGVNDRRYRGLQLSYTQAVRDFSVGHLLQWHEIERLAAEGVTAYDLGMDIDYKHRFADSAFVTRALVLHNS